MSFPSAEDAERLHERLLGGDPIASAHFCEAYLEPLTQRLERANPGTDPHLIAEAAETAVLDLAADPLRFDPTRSALATFLTMMARRDLSTLCSRERRRQSRQKSVELDRLAGNHSRQEQPLLRLVTQEETAEMRAVVQEVAAESTPTEREVLRLITDGEKATEAFAEVLGIDDRSPREQQDETLRAKDRMKKRLTRRYRRHG